MGANVQSILHIWSFSEDNTRLHERVESGTTYDSMMPKVFKMFIFLGQSNALKSILIG